MLTLLLIGVASSLAGAVVPGTGTSFSQWLTDPYTTLSYARQLQQHGAVWYDAVDFNNLCGIHQLQNVGLDTAALIHLRAVTRAVVALVRSPQTDGNDEVMRSAAFLWTYWTRARSQNADLQLIDRTLRAISQQIRTVLFGPEPGQMLNEAALLNWLVFIMKRAATMPTSAALVIIATNMILALEPSPNLWHPAEQVIRDYDEAGVIRTGPVRGFHQQFHVQVQLYARAILDGDRSLKAMAREAVCYLQLPVLDPVMFLVSILFEMAADEPWRRAADFVRHVSALRMLTHNSDALMLALAFHLASETDVVRYLARNPPIRKLLRMRSQCPTAQRIESELLERFPKSDDFRALLEVIIAEAVDCMVRYAPPKPFQTPQWTQDLETPIRRPPMSPAPATVSRTPLRKRTLLQRLRSLGKKNVEFNLEPAPLRISELVCMMKRTVPISYLSIS